MPVLGVLIGLAGGYFFWQEKQRIALVDGQGVEAVAALIQIRQQTSSQNKSTSYWADIRWRDRTGAERRAEKIRRNSESSAEGGRLAAAIPMSYRTTPWRPRRRVSSRSFSPTRAAMDSAWRVSVSIMRTAKSSPP
jgi:hypothetical protein